MIDQARVRPIRTAEEHDQLQTLARADGHGLVAPSHLITKGGEIVGYGSVATVPLLFVWTHSRLVRARESLHLLNLGENLIAALGHRHLIVPCADDSPYAPCMPAFGYTPAGKGTLWHKPL
jgi:hypothetical protein